MGQAQWRNTRTVCALTDDERHLGHIYKVGGQWHAYDATRLNPEGNSFRLLGIYPSLVAAKDAIEHSLGGKKVLAGAA